MPAPLLADRVPADPSDADALYAAFAGWAADQGLTLYPHQEEALLALVTGEHVIITTPTGSGKSLVAAAAHFVAFAQGRRTVYTAPLKALVSEKFFALVHAFGSSNVGMMTGDSSVNPDAPILCCTAEILANLALRDGEDADAAQVVMDEFHFYADPQRGWAWQVPLLELPRTQFVLMSATLGDVTFFADDLRRRTGMDVATITGTERPVPLTYAYCVEPLHELLEELVQTHRAPVYVVHFTQREAVERAQALANASVATRAQRDAIADELGAFRFGPGFGRTLSRLLRPQLAVPDERLIKVGDPGDAMYFIASGVLEVMAAGQRILLSRGDFVGEMALVLNQRRQADVTALSYCLLLTLDRRDFQSLLRGNTQLREIIDREANARARMNEDARAT